MKQCESVCLSISPTRSRPATGPTVRANVSGYVVSTGNIGVLIATSTYISKYALLYLQGHYVNPDDSSLIGFLVAVVTWKSWKETQLRRAGGRADVLEAAPAMVRRLGHLHLEYRYTL